MSFFSPLEKVITFPQNYWKKCVKVIFFISIKVLPNYLKELSRKVFFFLWKKSYSISFFRMLPIHKGTLIKRWKLARDVATLAKT
jgi:hypothetical protein